MECSKCKKINDKEANFCGRCGIKLQKLENCPVCLNKKECLILFCGHSCCKDCLNKFDKKNNYIKCPQCRQKIKQCIKCYGYRVLENEKGEECLDCGHKISLRNNINKNNIICIDCNSSRLIYNFHNKSYSCQDCFINFKINTETGNSSNLNSSEATTSICSLCCSNEITGFVDSGQYIYYCKNCKNKDIKIKHISYEEYSKLRIKDKEEVNKKKILVCSVCHSDKIFNMSMDDINTNYYCNSCNKPNVKTINI